MIVTKSATTGLWLFTFELLKSWWEAKTKLLMMVRIQLNILQSKLFDSFQYIIIFIQSLVFYLLLVIKISIILIDSTTFQLCWNMYHVCLEFVQKAIPCCRCIDCANFSKNCRNDSKITTFAKYRQWSLL